MRMILSMLAAGLLALAALAETRHIAAYRSDLDGGAVHFADTALESDWPSLAAWLPMPTQQGLTSSYASAAMTWTNVGATWATNGGGSASFNGTSYMAAATAFAPGTNDFTACMWVLWPQLLTNAPGVFGCYRSAASDRWGFYSWTGNYVVALLAESTTTREAKSAPSWIPTTGVWYHVACAWNRDGNASLYIDGAGVTNVALTGTTNAITPADNTILGAYRSASGAPASFGYLRIDDPRIYSNTAMTAAAISNIYVSGRAAHK